MNQKKKLKFSRMKSVNKILEKNLRKLHELLGIQVFKKDGNVLSGKFCENLSARKIYAL